LLYLSFLPLRSVWSLAQRLKKLQQQKQPQQKLQQKLLTLLWKALHLLLTPLLHLLHLLLTLLLHLPMRPLLLVRLQKQRKKLRSNICAF
jgi:hypothetical protein